jgi:hypothetical protein
MLHITDGECVAGTLREAAIPGVVATYGDLLYEGPVPPDADEPNWFEIRAQFLAGVGYATLDEAREFQRACAQTLAAYSEHDEVVIWLDGKLSNQLILIRVLDWFRRQSLGGGKLSLICIGEYPGVDRFRGLGALTAAQLAPLLETRRPVGEAQYRIAQGAWQAFTAPDPGGIQRLLATDTSALPFLAGALRRHLEQFPSVENGLSRTEQQALLVLRERGAVSGGELFAAVQRTEEPVFLGDLSFYRMMADLSAARHPLLLVADRGSAGLGTVTMTEAGREVVAGRADQDCSQRDRSMAGRRSFAG